MLLLEGALCVKIVGRSIGENGQERLQLLGEIGNNSLNAKTVRYILKKLLIDVITGRSILLDLF